MFGSLTGQRRELFDCLFSPEAEKTPIRTGMYGRPSIGATSIRHKILQEDDDLRDLKAQLRGAPRHIVLAGSCFGGTGSGGVPMLAQEFHRMAEQKGSGYDLKVDALVFLPWFRLVLPAGETRRDDRDLHERLNDNFEPNAAAGINTFKDRIRDVVDSLILVGVNDPGGIVRESNEASQGETVHILNLFAALLIQNHFAGHLDPPRGISGYWYESDHGLDPRQLTVHRPEEGTSLTLQQVIHRTRLHEEWLGLLRTYFAHHDSLPKAHQPLFLQAVIDLLKGAALTEGQITDRIQQALYEQREHFAEQLDWIRQMRDPHFFPLEQGSATIHGDRYSQAVKNPLEEITAWCDDKEVARTFEAQDLATPERFAEVFASRFLDNVAARFNLQV